MQSLHISCHVLIGHAVHRFKERNQNLNTKNRGEEGGMTQRLQILPRKRMRIVIKGVKKHVLGCVPCAQMVAVTSARLKMVAGNFPREK